MPSYNRAYIIERAIDSVVAQTFADWELIVVDDGSTDNTESVIEDIKDERIHFIKRSKNGGACAARNAALKKSKGKYLVFLDSDNTWDKEYLHKRKNVFDNSACDIVFGYALIKHTDGKEVLWPPKWFGVCANNRDYLESKLFMLCPLDLNTLAINRSCYIRCGGFDEQLSCAQDWDFFSKLIMEGCSFYFDESVLVEGRIQKNSIYNLASNIRWKSYARIIQKNYDYLIEKGLLTDAVASFLMRPDVKDADEKIIEEDLNWIFDGNHKEILQKIRIDLKKNYQFYNVLTRWLALKQKGMSLSDYFKKMDIKEIAVYGMKELGILLCEELKGSETKVAYVIDKNGTIDTVNGYRLYNPNELLPDVDMIVVTAIYYFEEIKAAISSNVYAKIISLTSIIDELEQGYHV
jgi:glycosyltransferase involved in cell wall biosynthesis